MNFPRITISLGKQDSEAPSADINMLFVGFALHQTWIFSVLFGHICSDGNAPYEACLGSSTAFLFMCLIFSVIFLIIFAATNQLFLRFYVSKASLFIAAGLCTVGTFVLLLSSLNILPASFIFAIISALMISAGSSMTICLWGTAYARYESPTIVFNSLFANVAGIALYAVFALAVPFPVSGFITVLIPLIEAYVLWSLTPIPYYKRQEVPLFQPLSLRKAAFALRVGIPTLLFGAGLGVVTQSIFSRVLIEGSVESALYIVIALLSCALYSFFILSQIKQYGSWDIVIRLLLPLIELGVLGFALTELLPTTFSSFAVIVGFIALDTALWTFFCDMAQEFRLSPIFVVSLGRAFVMGGMFGGVIICQELYAVTPDAFAIGVLILMTVLTAAYVLIPRQREVRQLISAQLSMYAHSEARATDELQHVIDAKSEGTDEKEKTRKGNSRFREKCTVIANTYLLSRRETEVLFLLAHGHNAAYIEESLVISHATAKTHINHIYRKMDIHTQQELLTMLDKIDVE